MNRREFLAALGGLATTTLVPAMPVPASSKPFANGIGRGSPMILDNLGMQIALADDFELDVVSAADVAEQVGQVFEILSVDLDAVILSEEPWDA